MNGKFNSKIQSVFLMIIGAILMISILALGIGQIGTSISNFVNYASNATGGNNTVRLGSLPFLSFFTAGSLIYLVLGAIVLILVFAWLYRLLRSGKR